MKLTKEAIVKLLETDDRAIARALLVLTARQTTDEQASEQTRYLNGRGYRPCHARMGASMSKFFERNGYLSPKQIAYWRCRDKTGSMRIGIYAGQLLEAAEIKAAEKAAKTVLPGLTGSPFSTANPMHPDNSGRDFGNDMERKMILEEQLGDVLDSDDPKIIDPIANEIDEIDQFWKKLEGNRSDRYTY
jgi:hypothetical protein